MLFIDSVLQLFSEVPHVVQPPDREGLALKALLAPETELEAGPVTVDLLRPRVLLSVQKGLQAEVDLPMDNCDVNQETTPADLDVATVFTSVRGCQR